MFFFFGTTLYQSKSHVFFLSFFCVIVHFSRQVQIAALRQYETEFDLKVTKMLDERDEVEGKQNEHWKNNSLFRVHIGDEHLPIYKGFK